MTFFRYLEISYPPSLEEHFSGTFDPFELLNIKSDKDKNIEKPSVLQFGFYEQERKIPGKFEQYKITSFLWD